MTITHYELATNLQIACQFDDWASVSKNLDYAKEHNIRVETRVTTRGVKSTLHITAMTPLQAAHQSIAGLPVELAHEMARELTARGADFIDEPEEARP